MQELLKKVQIFYNGLGGRIENHLNAIRTAFLTILLASVLRQIG